MFSFGIVAIVLSSFLFPMTLDATFATVIQMVSLFITQCCVSNYASIFAPTQVAIGTMRKSKPKLVVGLLQMFFMMLVPIAMLPQIAACGFSILAAYAEWLPYVPIYSILAIVALSCSCVAYVKLLTHQGKVLEKNELKVLEAVTSKDE
jgi:hypothetical protein